MNTYLPKWHRELSIFSKIKPVIVLEGNVLDSYQYPEDGSTPRGSILRLTEYLHFYLQDMGYETTIFYDNLRGFHNHCSKDQVERFASRNHLQVDNNCVKADFRGKVNSAPIIIREALAKSDHATGIVLDFASRYIASPEHLTQAEVDSFTILLQASIAAKDVVSQTHGTLKNLMILIVNKVNDLPAWFYLNNPNVKIIAISHPSKEEREALIKGENFPSFFHKDIYQADIAYFHDHAEELNRVQDRFIALTEGFSFTEINGLRRMCKNEKTRIKDMCEVIDLYKYGIRENPWKQLNASRILSAKHQFERRVKGQDYALTKTLDVIKRAMTGMAGLQSSSHAKPKGVLFFAGPTGTGKTETAKTLAEILFGDENRCIRFDMSEFGQSHSDQKLLGAPPGYVGYETGGQLTNAVKSNPFSILLFDEIEKAHPSIFDKFLQILEDGRMTDGQGNTVYFSETVIIFTSNLGIYTLDEAGQRTANVNSGMSYLEMSDRVRKSVEDYFKLDLGRPEILNRIGENIVVFDYIRPEVAKLILDAQVGKIMRSLATDKQIELTLSEIASETLYQQALANLANGGRGIGNIVESVLINPLSRFLFDHEVLSNAVVEIEAIDLNALPPALKCRVSRTAT